MEKTTTNTPDPFRSFIYKRMILRAILNNIIIRKKNIFKLLLIKHHINIMSLKHNFNINYKIMKSYFKNTILL